jgi:hypothetical protein
MMDSAATALGCSHGLAYSIMHDHLEFRKLWARWVPRELKHREKMNQMGLSLQHLLWYADEGEDMLNRTFTGDESWVHQWQPKSKCAPVQWKHPSSPSTKEFKVTPSARKVMLTVFWDSLGVLLAHYQKCKCEFWTILWTSVEASGCNSQKTSRPTGKRVTASSWEYQTRMQRKQPRGEFKNYSRNFLNIHLTAHTWPLVTSISMVCWKTTLLANVWLKMKRLNQRCRSGWDTSKMILSCRFWCISKVMGQVYQCWWRICQEINVFSRFEYHMFYLLYPIVTFLLTIPYIRHTVIYWWIQNMTTLYTLNHWPSACLLVWFMPLTLPTELL